MTHSIFCRDYTFGVQITLQQLSELISNIAKMQKKALNKLGLKIHEMDYCTAIGLTVFSIKAN